MIVILCSFLAFNRLPPSLSLSLSLSLSRVVIISDRFPSSSLSMSDDGSYIAVGGRERDQSAVIIYDADNLKKVRYR